MDLDSIWGFDLRVGDEEFILLEFIGPFIGPGQKFGVWVSGAH